MTIGSPVAGFPAADHDTAVGHDPAAGAVNILTGCAGVTAGQHVVLVGEAGAGAFFDRAVCDTMAAAVRGLGATAGIIECPPVNGGLALPAALPDALATAMTTADCVLFFARIGDQLRFTPLPGTSRKLMCYARCDRYLGDRFARLPYGLFRDVLDSLEAALAVAGRWRIRCRDGTDLTGRMVPVSGAPADPAVAGFSVVLFPTMTFAPLSCAAMSGRLVLSRFLISTSTTRFDDSLLPIDRPVTATIADGLITRFDGPAGVVSAIEAHLARCAAAAPDAARRIHSWHAGIYPPTFFAGDGRADIESWADVAFGSPRYTHFHLTGPAPGMVSASLFDTTIDIDGVPFWQDGRFVFLDNAPCRALHARYGSPPGAFDNNPMLGIDIG